MKLPTLSLTREALLRFEDAIRKEWLVTNGLGGYASSTVSGINTRKYHGLLVAALHPPRDRTVCLAKLDEEVVVGDRNYSLGANEFRDTVFPRGYVFLKEFSASPFPKHVYALEDVEVQRTVFMPRGKNATVAAYNVQNGNGFAVTVKIFPLLTCRHFHTVVDKCRNPLTFSQQQNSRTEVQLIFSAPKATVTIRATQGEFKARPNWIDHLYYREEAARGESSLDDCYQPGFFEVTVSPRQEADFAVVAVANENSPQNEADLGEIDATMNDVKQAFMWELDRRSQLLTAFYGSRAAVPFSDWLSWVLLAADSFIVESAGNGRSIIAGYHWFETWGRDTFISLPGLMLVTGRFEEARSLLLNFGSYCTDGLIPNFLQDFSGQPSCNTADATLLYVNAVLQYLKYTGDFGFVKTQLWETVKGIVEYHVEGTSFDIRMDCDGLLAHGPRLTWMDAEVDGKAATPRSGKAVEIQALWYNALRTAHLLAERFGEKKLAETYAGMAGKAAASFNQKFWNGERNCLYDVIAETGEDASLRPNQIIAVSLDFNMLNGERSRNVVHVVQRELLTPCGLRTLERSDSRYRGVYFGDRRSRDQAYHNGTVWPWLLGPFTTAFLKANGCTDSNRQYALKNLIQPLLMMQMSQAGLGTISEIFDGDEPHMPRGCIAQAWSIAEPLRAYVEDVLLVRNGSDAQTLRNR